MIERSEDFRFALESRQRSASRANASGNTFSATSRPSFESRARYTSPIPPLPIAPVISYAPSFVPVARLILICPLLVDVLNHADVLLQYLLRLKRDVASVGRCVKLHSSVRRIVVKIREDRDDR